MDVNEAVAKTLLYFSPLKQYYDEIVLSEVSVYVTGCPPKEDLRVRS